MKKLFSYVAMLLLPVAVSAQVIVGGSIGFDASSSKSTLLVDGKVNDLVKNDSRFGFEIAPKVGYIINEKLEVGASIGLGYSHNMKTPRLASS